MMGCEFKVERGVGGGLTDRYSTLRWKVLSYRQSLDIDRDTYRLELTVEHVEDQRSMESIRTIPQPSQLDDWQLYERLESEKIRKSMGEQKLLEWRILREQDKLDKAHWQRARAFTSSLSVTRRKSQIAGPGRS